MEQNNMGSRVFILTFKLALPFACCFALAVAASSQIDANTEITPLYAHNDDLGAINNLSRQGVLTAAGLIKTGKVYSLAYVTGSETPAYGDRSYQIVTTPIYRDGQAHCGSNEFGGFDEMLISNLGIGTQMDGFAHVNIAGRHFGDALTEQVVQARGAVKYGIATVPPIVGRGVMLDMTTLYPSSIISDSTPFNREEIERVAQRQNVSIGRGDIVLLHTGWGTLMATEPDRFLATPPGLGLAGAKYLSDLGVVAIGADQWVVEALPAENPEQFLPVHGKLLVERGVHILENVRSDELATDKAYEFFFMLAAPRFQGAVQSVAHPVAIR
jgi:kynurenine formamidase